jgi:hypothetical protein
VSGTIVAAATQPLDNLTVKMQAAAGNPAVKATQEAAKKLSRAEQLKIFGARSAKGILGAAIGYPLFTGVSTYLDFREGAKKHASLITSDVYPPDLGPQSTQTITNKSLKDKKIMNSIKLQGFRQAAEFEKEANLAKLKDFAQKGYDVAKGMGKSFAAGTKGAAPTGLNKLDAKAYNAGAFANKHKAAIGTGVGTGVAGYALGKSGKDKTTVIYR